MKKTRSPRPAARRRWGWRIGAAILSPLVFLAVAELSLRVFGYGFSTDLFTKADGTNYTVNEKFLRRFYSGNAAKGKVLPGLVPADKPPGAARIFVLGESAAQGTPEPAFGFARILEFMLRAQFPQERFEVVNAAMRGVNSHVLRPAARECAARRPDVFVLYIGNNEVIGLHAPGPDATFVDRHRALMRLSDRLKSFRLGQWLATWGDKAKRPPKQDMEFFRAHRIALDDSRRQAVYQNFRANLEDICQAAAGARAKTVLATVAANLRDFPPLGSLHRPDMTPAEIREWDALYLQGAAAETNGQPAGAVRHFLAAARVDDRYAELHFRLARAHDALGQFDEARKHFALARDHDALVFRADAKVNEVIRDAAARRGGGPLTLVDIERAFAEDSAGEHGIPGERLFYDHVHLNFDGDYLIAKTLFPAVVAALGKSPPASTPLSSRAECAAALGFTAWHEVEIAGGIVASASQPPYLDQLEHAQRHARAEQALNARRQQLTAAAVQQSAATLAAAVARSPQDWQLHSLYGEFALAQGDFKTAAEHLAVEVNLFPDRLKGRMEYASALAQAGRRSEAIAEFKEVLRLDPGNAAADQALSWLLSPATLNR